MHVEYQDIIDRAGKPDWYDQNATPRYGQFDPRAVTIYSDEVVLYRIRCQACGAPFNVVDVAPTMGAVIMRMGRDELKDAPEGEVRRRMRIDRDYLHFGDPPNSFHRDDRCAGSTMNCDDIAVIQWWRKDEDTLDWYRVPELEGLLDEPVLDTRAPSEPTEKGNEA